MPAAEGRRVPWWLAVAICAVLVLVTLGTWGAYRWMERKAGTQELATALVEAQDLAAEGDLRAAHQKYRDLDRRAMEIGTGDPKIKAIADQARTEQEQVFAMLLLQSASPGSVYGVPGPSTQAGPVDPATTNPAPPDATVEAPEETTPAAPTPSPAPASQKAVATNAVEPVRPSPTERDAMTRPVGPATTQRVARRPPLRPVPETNLGITDDEIGESIQRGVEYLIPLFDKRTGQIIGSRNPGQDEGYICGFNALCVYSLLQAGQAIPDLRLNVRGPFMKSLMEGMKRLPANTGKATYARGIRATALALYNRKEDRSALRADVTYLLLTHTDGSYTYAGQQNASSFRGGSGAWDNSNSQYGLLGVWSGAEVGVEVPAAYWASVQKHWTQCQTPEGTWNYTNANSGTVSMTAAGTASMFVAEDYLYTDHFAARVGREPFSAPLKRALDWWEKGESIDGGVSGWWGYTMYGIERVGLASGFKYFGKHDWYRVLAGRVVERQQADGSWGDPIDTAYALLFLARGRHPILMNKLRFDKGGATGEIVGFWGNRPRDAANLARYAGKQLERPLNWQVVGLDREWHDWLDSPILSIASHRTPYFTDADYGKFRNYVEAGGMLYLQADGGAPEFDSFARRFAVQVFPQYELKDLQPTHLLYNTLYKVTPSEPLKAVTNGTRILMLYSPRDLAKSWQAREEDSKESAFQLGVNLFVYAAGKRELRNRLSSTYISPPEDAAPLGSVGIARVKYNGVWDPEPGAWRRFGSWFHRQTGTALAVDTISLDRLDAAVDQRFAHLTGNTAYTLTEADKRALRAYVDGGGVVFVDSCGGDNAFLESVLAGISEAFPEQTLKPLSTEHPLFQAGAPGMDDLRRARLRPFAIERSAPTNPSLRVLQSGKGVIVISSLDVVSGLLGTQTWGIYGYEPTYAQSMMKNLIFWMTDGTPE